MPEETKGQGAAEKKKNHELVLLSTYASLQKAAKSYLEYAIEIRPISNYAEKRRAWRISSLSVSLDIGSCIVEYGLPSGKNPGIGIYFGQMLVSKLSSLISKSWPKPPEMEEIKRCISDWFSEYQREVEEIPEKWLKILARGISFLLQSLFLYADAILETSVGLGPEAREEWSKLLDIEKERLDEEVLSAIKAKREI